MVVAVLCLLAGMTSACTSRDHSSALSPAELLATAVENTLDVPSAAFTYEMYPTNEDPGSTTRGRGVMREDDFDVELQVATDAGAVERTQLRAIGAEVYGRFGADPSWQHLGRLGTPGLAPIAWWSPQGHLALLENRTGVTDKGVEATGSIDCRRLQFEIPADEYQAVLYAVDISEFSSIEGTITVDVWVGVKDSLIHRLQFAVSGESPGTWAYEFSDFGSEVSIEVPEGAIEAPLHESL